METRETRRGARRADAAAAQAQLQQPRRSARAAPAEASGSELAALAAWAAGATPLVDIGANLAGHGDVAAQAWRCWGALKGAQLLTSAKRGGAAAPRGPPLRSLYTEVAPNHKGTAC